MSTDRLDRPHVFLPAEASAAGPPLLLLHGTGGDEHDLLPLRDLLSPGAAVLAVRGTVLENGMPRFFRRLREGVFDEDDLRRQADELADVRDDRERRVRDRRRSLVAVGFSNGANIASPCCCSVRVCCVVRCCCRPWSRSPSRRPPTWAGPWWSSPTGSATR